MTTNASPSVPHQDEWSLDEWLKNIHPTMVKYKRKLKKFHYDTKKTLALLVEKDVDAMGIKGGHKQLLLKAVKDQSVPLDPTDTHGAVTEASLTPTSKHAIEKLVEAKMKTLKLKSSVYTTMTPGTMAEWYNDNSSHPVPFWFPENKDPKNAFFTKHSKFILDHTATETENVLPMWNELVVELKKLTNLTVHPSTSPGTIGSQKPHIPCYVANQAANIYYLTVVGEIKGGRSYDNFSAEEKGQVASFLAKLLKLTHRPFCFGFLTDGRIIQFFKGCMVESQFSMTESSVDRMVDNGGYYLLQLLSQPLYSLGNFNNMNLTLLSEPLDITGYLGYGSCSTVYKGSYKSKDVVVKYFLPQKDAFANTEEDTLNKIQSLVPSVPGIIGFANNSSNHKVLVFDSVGIPFSGRGAPRLTSAHFCDLISILQKTHAKGVVHRDVKIHNFFQRTDASDKVLLNDWSIAAVCEIETTVRGTPTLMPSELLLQPAYFKYHPQPYHDLESVVKMFYLFLFPGECPFALEQILDFWNRVNLLSYWKNMF